MAIKPIQPPLSPAFVKAMDAGKKVLDEMYHKRMIKFFNSWNIMGGAANVNFKTQLVQDLFERGF